MTINENQSKQLHILDEEAEKNDKETKQSVSDKKNPKILENYSDVLKNLQNNEEKEEKLYRDQTTFNHFEIKKNEKFFDKIQKSPNEKFNNNLNEIVQKINDFFDPNMPKVENNIDFLEKFGKSNNVVQIGYDKYNSKLYALKILKLMNFISLDRDC